VKTAFRILTLSPFLATCAAEAGPPGLSFDNAKNRYICTQCGVDWIPAYENQYWIHGDIVINETVQPPYCYL
jgi:hypothetical protein